MGKDQICIKTFLQEGSNRHEGELLYKEKFLHKGSILHESQKIIKKKIIIKINKKTKKVKD